jgi:hypothetical protein
MGAQQPWRPGHGRFRNHSPSATPGSTLQCQVNALLSGQPQGASFSELDTIMVPQPATTLTYNGDQSQDFNDPATLKVTLSDAITGQPIGNVTINVALAGQTCVGTTDPAVCPSMVPAARA